MHLTFVLTRPETFSNSPRNAFIKDDLPDPTGPTTATSDPSLILVLIFFRTIASSEVPPHENVPFSIIRGSARKS